MALPAILISTISTMALAGANDLSAVWGPPAFVEDVDSDCSELASGWSNTERYVWAAVCAGAKADLNELLGGRAHPKIPFEIAKVERRLSSDFLQTILFQKPFRNFITRYGVRITGAYFDEAVDLREGILPWQIQFFGCRFEGDLVLRGLHAKRQVSIEVSFVGGNVDVRSARFESHLLLGGAFLQKDLLLRGSEVGGRLDLDGAEVEGKFDMVSATVKSHMLTAAAIFQAVELEESEIGGQLDMRGARVKGTFNMVSATVKSHMLTSGAAFQAMHLAEAEIGGRLDMAQTVSVGHLDLSSTRIGSHLLFFEVPIRPDPPVKSVILRNAQIGGDLDLTQSEIKDELNMASASVGLTFKIGADAFTKLNLQNTAFSRVITDSESEEEHPKLHLEMEGFTYYRFEVLTDDDGRELQEKTTRVSALSWIDPVTDFSVSLFSFLGSLFYRPVAIVLCRERIGEGNVFVEWLAQDRGFSHQPYRKLATVLQNDGESRKADEVLYAAKDRERCEKDTGLIRYLGLTLFQLALGHGIVSYIFRAFYWVMPTFVSIGWLVLWLTGERWKHVAALHEPIGFWFSLDHFLPVMRLDARFQNVRLRRRARLRIPLLGHFVPFPVRWYFCLHQIAGYVLVILVIAGLTGMMR